MVEKFEFKIIKKDKKTQARLGIIKTKHGAVNTPYLIPVATTAVVKSLDSRDLENMDIQCVLANTYHLSLRPGDKIIKKAGGLHKFMSFNKPIFTDSGGFQAFSLGYGLEHNISKIGGFFPKENLMNEKNKAGKNLAKITDKGVSFKSVYDGSTQFISPKISMQIQSNLGADIIMAFDECTSPLHNHDYTKRSLERTNKWLVESLKYRNKKQAIYGIIQGGEFKDLRIESAKFVNSLPFEGIAIGGALGKSKKTMNDVLDWVIPITNYKKPRHMLGIGEIEDIFNCVERGIDTFDCVNPTRIARKGNLYILPKSGGRIKNGFRIRLKNSAFKNDFSPIDKNCNCSTCKKYSKAYLRHLCMVQDQSYARLATIHNIQFILNLMKSIREAIAENQFSKLKKSWLK